MTPSLPPGSQLGILGGGQLGRMFALAARNLGYGVTVFAPEEKSPAGQVADAQITADYEDEAALRRFAESVAAVSYEFENIPVRTIDILEESVPVRPGRRLLFDSQNRLREKRALNSAGIATVAFAEVRDESSLEAAVAAIGTPSILKTAAWGYDGKGQARVESREKALDSWLSIGSAEAILEAMAPFDREFSIVGARGVDGSVALYEPTVNDHRRHILDVSVAPAGLESGVQERAQTIVEKLLVAWDVVGVLCVEMFLMPNGEILVNEVAPRPHNSGHLTIDACVTSQFEQQVRALCGLPLGSTRMRGASAMVNLLGEVWSDGEPNWAAAAAMPVHLHLYGKSEPRRGRKMGHITAVAETADEARSIAEAARRALRS